MTMVASDIQSSSRWNSGSHRLVLKPLNMYSVMHKPCIEMLEVQSLVSNKTTKIFSDCPGSLLFNYMGE